MSSKHDTCDECAKANVGPCPHASTAAYQPEILDACCGGRMWWWDKAHPLAVYADKRERPAGTIPQKPLWKIAPDVLADFRALPFDDESFRLVVFDPPHQTTSRAGTGINAEQYGSWKPGERDEALRLGLAECWRVLVPGGTLVFKWGGKVAEVQAAFPVVPVVGTRPRGRHSGPSWVVFYKPFAAATPSGRLESALPQYRSEPAELLGREGMVTVWDDEGRYVGCMGVNLWRHLLTVSGGPVDG